MTPEAKAELESLLITARQFHIFAHIGDDRIFEFLATQEHGGARDGAGRIVLDLLGSAGESDDGSIFQHIGHQLLIYILPLGVEGKVSNLRLMHSRIELGSFGAHSLRLCVVVTDASDGAAIDMPFDTRALSARLDASLTAMTTDRDRLREECNERRAAQMSYGRASVEMEERMQQIQEKAASHLSLAVSAISYIPDAVLVGDIRAKRDEIRNVLKLCDVGLREMQSGPSIDALNALHSLLWSTP